MKCVLVNFHTLLDLLDYYRTIVQKFDHKKYKKTKLPEKFQKVTNSSLKLLYKTQNLRFYLKLKKFLKRTTRFLCLHKSNLDNIKHLIEKQKMSIKNTNLYALNRRQNQPEVAVPILVEVV